MGLACLWSMYQMKKNSETKNECGGLIVCVSKEQNARELCQKNAHILQRSPYQ